MIETTSTLAPYEVDDLDAETLLVLARDAETDVRRSQRRVLRLAVRWAVLHPATADTGVETWDGPGLLADESLGGEGTPAVAAFTAEPLALALGLAPTSGAQLLADVLDLTHRLPGVWARVESLEVPAWQARHAARTTHTLSREAARWVDAELTGVTPTATRLEGLVARAVARFHPDRLEAHERRGRHGHDVRLTHELDPATGLAGTARLDATGDAVDLTRFYDLICAIATRLGALGDTDPLGARKAKALGLIADAQAGLPLTADDALSPAHTPASRRDTTLFLHLDLHDLGRGDGIGHAERLGPVLQSRIQEWVGAGHTTITPVLHLGRDQGVDSHDPPSWMRELVLQRDAHCVFPGCTRPSRRCDLDHIDPYDDSGPPGRTNPGNLAPLCRRHHRAKTARRWRYRRRPDGTYQWTTPGATGYLVTPDGTLAVDLT